MESPPPGRPNLARLLRNGAWPFRVVEGEDVEVCFAGLYRPWIFHLSCVGDWFTMWAQVCGRHDRPAPRAALAELLLELNQRHPLVKYSLFGGGVILQLQYRREHLSRSVLSNLLGLISSCAGEDYPRIVRLLSGEATLDALEKAYCADGSERGGAGDGPPEEGAP